MYAAGLGTLQDEEQDWVWYRQAAQQYYPAAQVAMELLDAGGKGRGGSSARGANPQARSAGAILPAGSGPPKAATMRGEWQEKAADDGLNVKAPASSY